MDPTPKRNLILQSQIPPARKMWPKSPRPHPEENLGWEELEIKKLLIKLLPPTTTTTLTVL